MMTGFLSFVSFKYGTNFDKMVEDYQDYIKNEYKLLNTYNINDDYKTFVDNNEERLENEYGESIDFQTSIRGLKVRGVFGSQKEAELRCKLLREVDPNHDVYVGPVGMWIPFHPDAYKTGRVEYMEETLNQLMNEKKTNEDNAKKEFDKRVKDAKEKAMEENKRNAEKSGNKLTQTLNSAGELVNVKNLMIDDADDADDDDDAEEDVEDICKSIFNTDNVVLDKNSDHGLSLLTENKKVDDDDDDDDMSASVSMLHLTS